MHQPTELRSRISELIIRARSSRMPIIYTQYGGPPGTLVKTGSFEGQIHAAVALLTGDRVIQKNDSDAFLQIELQAEWEKLEVSTPVVCGTKSEFC